MPFRVASILLIIVMAVPAWGAAQAGRLYIIDYIQVGVRQNPANNSTVLETVKTGASVARLGLSSDQLWIKVRTQAGTEGWIMARYLMENPPAAQLLSEMPRDQTEMLSNLRQENSLLQAQAQEKQELASQWQQRYETLAADSRDVVSLKKEYNDMQARLEEQSARLQELETENNSLHFTSNVVWFLSGGSVLLLGCFLGWMFGRRKRSGWSSSIRY
ncbi:MAG: TIGR04211 family SH3 domain-containing protein [Desulfarculales bacterium]|jgi:SH3 domain protein|nr:TIGR04211 family SH3 domain-containing protein [Desulfarculales bacterium]